MELKALALNCTLKKSPEISNTEALIKNVFSILEEKGVVVTGNEDGAHSCGESMCFNLMHLGCTIPPNVDTYWVGEAGPGPSYLELGKDSEYTKRTTKWAAHNLWHFAKLLKERPIPAEGNTL